jgi:hypothetical protein
MIRPGESADSVKKASEKRPAIRSSQVADLPEHCAGDIRKALWYCRFWVENRQRDGSWVASGATDDYARSPFRTGEVKRVGSFVDFSDSAESCPQFGGTSNERPVDAELTEDALFRSRGVDDNGSDIGGQGPFAELNLLATVQDGVCIAWMDCHEGYSVS